MTGADLLVVRIERRRIAVAAFSGTRLEHVQARELSADLARANCTAERFVTWALEMFEPKAVMLEQGSVREGTRRRKLAAAIERRLAQYPLGFESVPPQAGTIFGVPEPRSQRAVQDVARTIWPDAARQGKEAGLQAAALGLHFQMHRLLNQ